MTNFINTVLAIFSAHAALLTIEGPYEDQAPADAGDPTEAGGTERDWCTYTSNAGQTMLYMTEEPDRKTPFSVVFTAYTTSRGREHVIAAAIAAQFDQKQFSFTGGRCEWSRITSSSTTYAGTNKRSKRLYSTTVAIAFDCHAETSNSLDPATLPT